MATTVLLVEDENSLINYLRTELEFEDYRVLTAKDGISALETFRQHSEIKLIILDWMLPKLDGLEVMRRIRKSSDVGIIMMTARDYVGDKVAGLDAGADDYITKPFEIEELLARIRVILRHNPHELEQKTYQIGKMTLNSKTKQVRYDDQTVQLTQREYKLFLALIQHRDEVLTRDDLLDIVWGVDFDGQINVVDVYIRYLRNKLKDFTDSIAIETVRGIGYKLVEKHA